MSSHVKDKEQQKALDDLRYRIRHSASHVMADAVVHFFPEAKLTLGPPTEDGFYYDIDLPRPLTPEDLQKIEARMKEIVAADHAFVEEAVGKDAAKAMFKDNPYKLEIIESIPAGERITIYRHGKFTDLCEGRHVERTGKIGAFKLLNVAGAYWRGDEKNKMLQRIYGTAFESQEALDEHIRLLEEAMKRDHRKLGRELDLFSVHDESGAGLIFWHPKGARIRNIMEDFWRQEHYRSGYDLVFTPHIGKSKLWEVSGHLGFYQENMFAPMNVDEQQYYVKPMNCPFHILIYKNAMRSYRELPLRLAELGTVYRYERPGVLHGLMRVRGFTQDDAHIFCRPDQIEEEVKRVLDFTFNILRTFGFEDFEIYLSTKPEKSVGDPADWEKATQALRQAIESRNLEYEVDEGGGAFYGPKIDVKIKDALKRSWQCATIQFDFNEPQRFGMTFVGEDGAEHRPYMVHRALLGSLERFMGVLIEHYGGAFPVWLAPVQAQVIPIADRHLEYANKVQEQLRASGIRVQVDNRKERMNMKIREAQMQKVPYMLVVGDKEAEAGTVSVRLRTEENLGAIPLAQLIDRIQQEVNAKK